MLCLIELEALYFFGALQPISCLITKDKFAPSEIFFLFAVGEFGVDDGTRTHDDRDHNPGLYQLSYAHHWFKLYAKYGAPGRTRTCNPRLSLPTTVFTASHLRVCGLDYLFTISGAARIVSTDPSNPTRPLLVSTGLPSALPVKVSPLQCSPLHQLNFPMQAPILKADALSS